METQTAQQLHHQVVNVHGINIASYQRASDGQWIVLVTQPTPKGKYSKYKVLHHYRFGLEQRLNQWINMFVDKLNLQQAVKQERIYAKSAAQKAAKNPFKVGDLLYDSWGYDQTNIDFYQVTEVGKMSVVIRRIASKGVPGTQSFMSEDVVPQKDVFLTGDRYGEPLKRIVQVRVWGGVVSYGVRGYYDHGHLQHGST